MERLRETYPDRPITVVDLDFPDETADRDEFVETVRADAVEYLVNTTSFGPEDAVIATVPIHVAARFVVASRPQFSESALPDSLMEGIPNPWKMSPTTWFSSIASHVCPDDCAEGEICPITGEERTTALYEILSARSYDDFVPVVLRSIQLLPGVGGYPYGELLRLPERMTSPRSVLITSCKCHAVLTGIASS